MRTATLVFIALAAFAAPLAAAAQDRSATPDPRYRLEEVEDGWLRLDTVTGTTSHCRREAGNWLCTVASDERAALEAELDALRSEQRRLREQVARLTGELRRIGALADRAARAAQTDAAAAGAGPARPDRAEGTERAARGDDSAVPEEARREIDTALAVTEYAVRRLFRTFRDLEQELREDETR